jgi:hypothetical protein
VDIVSGTFFERLKITADLPQLRSRYSAIHPGSSQAASDEFSMPGDPNLHASRSREMLINHGKKSAFVVFFHRYPEENHRGLKISRPNN